ncbi:hypothetical protein [Paraburkholderia megapolitana]|uniref:Mannitol repressor n=1 Tax=Paraburkholderia megapolitana TaxID=420953 RepID=A0A1I3R2G6_9BURK|nr:hypothetical protein [Paraburkholderia megapolitana]QDQ83663.1 hypothetical protein FNZ07_21100 [Paraburkholderia megapolitana]SFJ40315.1 hypothetical protein SAMN05192543_1072 [Paraburkholderia megapolitana]
MNEIQKAHARFVEEMGVVDNTVHVLLKGHLLIEEALSRIIDQFVFHREHVAEARLSFAGKVHLCRALCLRKNDLGEWDLIAALNAFRNVIAHTLQSPQRARKFDRVKEIYLREAATMSGIEDVRESSEADVVLLACGHCLGFLSSFEGDARVFRQLVFNMDRSLNPELTPFDL